MKITRISFVLLFCVLFFGGCAQTHNNDSQSSNDRFETQELYARRDGKQIYGVIYIPQNAGDKIPTVIFSHGFGGNYQVGAKYAEALAKKGYAVYCFDFESFKGG